MRSWRGCGRCWWVSEHKACGDVQTPIEPLRAKVELCRTLEGLRDKLCHDQRAKALALGRSHGWPVPFDPLKIDAPIAIRAAPCHANPSLGGGERAVLVSVGDQLMQGKAEVLHGIGTQEQGRACNFGSLAGTEQIKMRPHQIAEPCALPVLLQQKVL